MIKILTFVLIILNCSLCVAQKYVESCFHRKEIDLDLVISDSLLCYRFYKIDSQFVYKNLDDTVYNFVVSIAKNDTALFLNGKVLLNVQYPTNTGLLVFAKYNIGHGISFFLILNHKFELKGKYISITNYLMAESLLPFFDEISGYLDEYRKNSGIKKSELDIDVIDD
jgi:hypothetical protein